MRQTTRGVIGVMGAAVLATACGAMNQTGPGPTSLSGPDGGRVGTLALRPGELTSGTGTEPGTPSGGGPTPGLSCQDGAPWIQVNVDPGGIAKFQIQQLAGATGYDVVAQRRNGGEVVYTARVFSVFGQTGVLRPGNYEIRATAYRPTCTPQRGTTSRAVPFSINGPGDNPELVYLGDGVWGAQG